MIVLPVRGQPIGATEAWLAATAASGVQVAASTRLPFGAVLLSDTSHASGATSACGGTSFERSKPASSGIIGVSAGPPGTSTLTVTPVPARSWAMMAECDSSAAFEPPYGAKPRRIIDSWLVVTLTTRPQFC